MQCHGPISVVEAPNRSDGYGVVASPRIWGRGSATRRTLLVQRLPRSLIGKATFRVWACAGVQAGRPAVGTDQAAGRRRKEALKLGITEKEGKQGSCEALRETKRGFAPLKPGEPDEVGDQRSG